MPAVNLLLYHSSRPEAVVTFVLLMGEAGGILVSFWIHIVAYILLFKNCLHFKIWIFSLWSPPIKDKLCIEFSAYFDVFYFTFEPTCSFKYVS